MRQAGRCSLRSCRRWAAPPEPGRLRRLPPLLARSDPHGLRDLISPRGERVTGLLGGKEGDASQDDLRG